MSITCPARSHRRPTPLGAGTVITDYDSAGRIAGIRDQASGLYYAGATPTDATNRIQYTAHGAVTAMKLRNGIVENVSYNGRLQPTQITLNELGAQGWELAGMTYDGANTHYYFKRPK